MMAQLVLPETQVSVDYRAQVKSLDGRRWVDGGLFRHRSDADNDATRLSQRHETAVRVIEVER